MAYQPNPNDPYRAGLTDEEIRQQARINSLDNEVPADPEMGERSRQWRQSSDVCGRHCAGDGGALFYGLNNTSVNQAGTTPPSQTAQTNPTSPSAPPGMRDVTPRANTESRHHHRCCAQLPRRRRRRPTRHKQEPLPANDAPASKQ